MGPTPPPKRTRWWLFLLCAAGVVFVGAVGFGGLVALVLFAAEEMEVAPEERALMLDAAALAAWMSDFTPDPRHETLVKTRYVDSSYDIDYTYDVPEDEASPYLNYTVTIEPSPGDAQASYVGMWTATRLGIRLFGGSDSEVTFEEPDALFSWGDSSRCAVVLADGSPVGNLFVGRKDRYVVYMLLLGLYFDETQPLTEFLGPYLERLESHRPA